MPILCWPAERHRPRGAMPSFAPAGSCSYGQGAEGKQGHGWSLHSPRSHAAPSAGMVSYEEVAYAAFGRRMRFVVVLLIFFLCWMIAVAYIVLAGDNALRVYEAFAGGRVNPCPHLLPPGG